MVLRHAINKFARLLSDTRFIKSKGLQQLASLAALAETIVHTDAQ